MGKCIVRLSRQSFRNLLTKGNRIILVESGIPADAVFLAFGQDARSFMADEVLLKFESPSLPDLPEAPEVKLIYRLNPVDEWSANVQGLIAVKQVEHEGQPLIQGSADGHYWFDLKTYRANQIESGGEPCTVVITEN